MPPERDLQIPCPQCGADVNFPWWTVLDLADEPELRSRFLAGEINVARCSICGQAGFAD